jgi:hypothetical protein
VAVDHAVFPPGREGAVRGAAAVGDGDDQLGGADLRGHAELGVGMGQAQTVIQAPLSREAVSGGDGVEEQRRHGRDLQRLRSVLAQDMPQP